MGLFKIVADWVRPKFHQPVSVVEKVDRNAELFRYLEKVSWHYYARLVDDEIYISFMNVLGDRESYMLLVTTIAFVNGVWSIRTGQIGEASTDFNSAHQMSQKLWQRYFCGYTTIKSYRSLEELRMSELWRVQSGGEAGRRDFIPDDHFNRMVELIKLKYFA